MQAPAYTLLLSLTISWEDKCVILTKCNMSKKKGGGSRCIVAWVQMHEDASIDFFEESSAFVLRANTMSGKRQIIHKY